MEELIKELINEQKKTNELLTYNASGKDPNELLDIEQVCKEFDIGINMARKVFKDPALPVQRYTKKHKVTRYAMQEYTKVSHDYLSERKWKQMIDNIYSWFSTQDLVLFMSIIINLMLFINHVDRKISRRKEKKNGKINICRWK